MGWRKQVHSHGDRVMYAAVGLLVALVLALVGVTVAYVASGK